MMMVVMSRNEEIKLKPPSLLLFEIEMASVYASFLIRSVWVSVPAVYIGVAWGG